MNFLKIIRPLNCIFVAFTVFFGGLYHSSLNSFSHLLFAALSALFISAGGYVINDFFDIPIDMINKPYRLLPAGKISPDVAYFYAITLIFFGILLSFLTANFINIIIAVFNSLLLFNYAKYFKIKLLSGNLIVAYAAASTFIYGGFANNNLKNSLVISIFAFIYTFSREIIKDMEDVAGDKQKNARTFPLVFGLRASAHFSLVPIILLSGYILYLRSSGFVSVISMILLFLLVIVPMVFFYKKIITNLKKQTFSLVSSYMKIDMLILLIILGTGL